MRQRSLRVGTIPMCLRSKRPSEVIRRRGPWWHVEAVEVATLAWVDWFTHRRLLVPIGLVPPVEFEQAYYRSSAPHAMVA